MTNFQATVAPRRFVAEAQPVALPLHPALTGGVSAAEKAALLEHYTEQAAQVQPRPKPTDPTRVERWLESLGSVAVLVEAKILAREVAILRGHGHTPQEGAQLLWSTLGDAEVLLEYEYSAGRPGRTYGPPEDCYESEPEEITVLSMFVNGQWSDVDNVVADSVMERWHEEIREHIAEQVQRDADDRAEARARDREEAWS